ncbi:chromatin-remodeling complex ATPase [Wickerhamomyces ciferrii]|uniref:Chromatin-remodeling complex ATPase n=1 Tax=Wickerhamomyces ciferrii (strain ATCC 14091 / BCRC 22168 / CBS 111 / JCM 3599 / NBRC 0793 / NRRL Y-1031 F-60-10) TaxID=1206466 RepID=K0KRW7_WICCF|nr:chromatin-remodeling complex ATPase [Wickerhamomyces ciferrii]CCH44088.1 chromatin-remodeling complex ATPase [Wickerhamomyces ciferrii]
MEDEEHEDETTVLTESPKYVHGKLREYQIQGLNWLIQLYENSLSGILADEMGLGKTLQTISFLGYLRYNKNIDGPFLIIVPKSTLDNWRREFERWTPDVNVCVLQGNKEERNDLIKNTILETKFDVLVTSFEMVIREKSALKKLAWQYIVVDEAHRIKNEESALSQIIRLFYSKNRLLITGTPLQNNLHELWALLNFILPDVFGDSEVFDQWFENQEDDQDLVIQQLHKVLNPFLLRRVKSDVEKSLLPKKEVNLYVGMSEMQVKWYQKLLEKDIDAVNGVVGKREGKTRLLNIVMQLRKCCNHPYLFEGAEPGPPFTTDEHLVFNSGKMVILDKLLKKMKEQGSRVLIFSQMSRVLDILEDYCFFRDYEYCRIDGSTSHEDRIAAIDDYNKPDSDKFIFLLTTRAGGLGINLTSADIVVLYDSDWNPQADLQAMDRAHRIGQKKQVMVFRFVTEDAIEEKVIERATQKLRLDQLVIQQGRAVNKNSAIGNNKEDLLSMIQFGAKNVFENKSSSLEIDIDEILKKGEEKTKSLNEKYSALGLDELQKFTSDQSAYEWNGENFAKKSNDGGLTWINPAKRERKEQTYSIDNYYKDVLQPKATPQPKAPKAPKQIHMQDHQFFNSDLKPILEKEQLYYKKQINYKVTLSDVEDDYEETTNDENGSTEKDQEYEDEDEAQAKKLNKKERRKFEQKRIDQSEALTSEEEELKQKYLDEAFSDWSRRDFTNFIQFSAKFGRDNYKLIAQSMNNKSSNDVERYAKTFWERNSEIEGHDKYITQIETGEKKVQKLINQAKLLKLKLSQTETPLKNLVIHYPPNNSKRVYSDVEDRFLLVTVNKIGLMTEFLFERVKNEIRNSEYFKFDWFFQSRTSQELARRTNTLLLAITREFEGPEALKRKRNRLTGNDNTGGSTPNVSRQGTVEPSSAVNANSNAVTTNGVNDKENVKPTNQAGIVEDPASKKQKIEAV